MARRVQDTGIAPVLVVANDASALTEASGFDDFVLMPLIGGELALRLRRMASRSDGPPVEAVTFKDLELDLATYQARLAGQPLNLTFMEYELLRFFVTNPARVWSREQLLEKVWGYDYFGGARTVDVHVRKLRQKLGKAQDHIETVVGVGYRFRDRA